MAKAKKPATTQPDAAGTANVRVGRSAIHGTGVFAERRFDPDEIIERCPVLTLDGPDADAVVDTVLGNYIYEWEQGYALALGYGSLYNHSHQPSARYEMDYEIDEIHVVARRRIKRGEEITISYNGDATDQAPVWFEEEGQ
jgi:uncharacterized protein